MTSSSNLSTPPEETPLGIQKPLLPPVPLGQSMLQPKFLTPLGARPLNVLDPSIFLPGQSSLQSDWQAPFQDSSFFDVPEHLPTSSVDSVANTAHSTAVNIDATITQPLIQTLPEPSNAPEIYPSESLVETATITESTITESLNPSPTNQSTLPISKVIEPSIAQSFNPLTNQPTLPSRQSATEISRESEPGSEKTSSTIHSSLNTNPSLEPVESESSIDVVPELQPSLETEVTLEPTTTEPGFVTPEFLETASTIVPSSTQSEATLQPKEPTQSESTATDPSQAIITQAAPITLPTPAIAVTTQPIATPTPSTPAEPVVQRKQEGAIAPTTPNPITTPLNSPERQIFAPESLTTTPTQVASDEVFSSSELAAIDASPDSGAAFSPPEAVELSHLDLSTSETLTPSKNPDLQSPIPNTVVQSISPGSISSSSQSVPINETSSTQSFSNQSINSSSSQPVVELVSSDIQPKSNIALETAFVSTETSAQLTQSSSQSPNSQPVEAFTPPTIDSAESLSSEFDSDSMGVVEGEIDPSLQSSPQSSFPASDPALKTQSESSNEENPVNSLFGVDDRVEQISIAQAQLEPGQIPDLSLASNSPTVTTASENAFEQKASQPVRHSENSFVTSEDTNYSSDRSSENTQENTQPSNSGSLVESNTQTSTSSSVNGANNNSTDYSSHTLLPLSQAITQSLSSESSVEPEVQSSISPTSHVVDIISTDSIETNPQVNRASHWIDDRSNTLPPEPENIYDETARSETPTIASTDSLPSQATHSPLPTIQAKQDTSAVPIPDHTVETVANDLKNINVDESIQANQSESNVSHIPQNLTLQSEPAISNRVHELLQFANNPSLADQGEKQDSVHLTPELQTHEPTEATSLASSSSRSTLDISTFPTPENSISQSTLPAEQAITSTAKALPELPTTIQRLSVWEPLVQLKSIAPVVESPPRQLSQTTQSTEVAELQWSEFSSQAPVNISPPATGDELQKIQRFDHQLNHNPPVDIDTTAASTRSVPAEWSNIAELFAASTHSRSESQPPEVSSTQGYTDLHLSSIANSSAIEMIQPQPDTTAPPSTPAHSPAPAEHPPSSQQSQPNASPEQLERLAQEIYRLVRQRLALERERLGQTYSGRLM